MSDTVSLTRQELYDRVWTTPAWKLGPEIGLSGRGLAKRCAREGIPVPERGYWAKLKFGRAPDRPPLAEPWPPDTPPKPTARRVDDTGQHELIAAGREHFTVGRQTNGGYLKPNKRLIADIFVSQKTLSRALDIANALYVSFEDRKHSVVIATEALNARRSDVDEREAGGREREWERHWAPRRPTVVAIGSVVFGLTIYELSTSVEVQYVDGKDVPISELTPEQRRRIARSYSWRSQKDLPSGRLCLRVYAAHPGVHWQREWREKKVGDLPGHPRRLVKSIEKEVPEVEAATEKAKHQAELDHQRWQAQQEEWRRQREEERRRQAAEASRQELYRIIEVWNEAKRLKGFFDELDKAGATLSEKEGAVFLDRLKQARAMIEIPDAMGRLSLWRTPGERWAETNGK